MHSGNQENQLKNDTLKNTFAMSFKKPLPLGGANFNKSGSMARENPFMKKSVNLRDSDSAKNSMEMNMVHRGDDL